MYKPVKLIEPSEESPLEFISFIKIGESELYWSLDDVVILTDNEDRIALNLSDFYIFIDFVNDNTDYLQWLSLNEAEGSATYMMKTEYGELYLQWHPDYGPDGSGLRCLWKGDDLVLLKREMEVAMKQTSTYKYIAPVIGNDGEIEAIVLNDCDDEITVTIPEFIGIRRFINETLSTVGRSSFSYKTTDNGRYRSRIERTNTGKIWLYSDDDDEDQTICIWYPDGDQTQDGENELAELIKQMDAVAKAFSLPTEVN